jgi:molybdopterin biosynthesis enzyme
MPRATIEAVERICREAPPLRVLPFKPMRVAALALERKLSWFGSELVAVGEARSGDRYASVLKDVLKSRPDLIMAAGASSLDPLEPLFGALEAVGARIVKHGVPVHPGSLFWIAYVEDVPLFGLSSCEMFSHRTILDLVLPRLFAGEPIGRDDLARLGHGGMLGREMAFRFPPYGPRSGGEAEIP